MRCETEATIREWRHQKSIKVAKKFRHLIDRPIIKTQSSKTLMDVHVARECEIATEKRIPWRSRSNGAMTMMIDTFSTREFYQWHKKKELLTLMTEKERTKEKRWQCFFSSSSEIEFRLYCQFSQCYQAVRASALDFGFRCFCFRLIVELLSRTVLYRTLVNVNRQCKQTVLETWIRMKQKYE